MNEQIPSIAIRNNRIQTAVRREKPDRVPFMPTFQNFYALGYDTTIYEAMKDLKSVIPAMEKLLEQYDPDLLYVPGFFPIDVMERAGAKNLRWPGEYWGLPLNTPYQYVDASFIEDDEDWDRFINDPTAFLLQKVLPGRYQALEGLSLLNVHAMCSQAPLGFGPLGMIPPLRQSLQSLLEIADISAKAMADMTAIAMRGVELGYPIWGNFCVMSPFDEFADCVRGIVPSLMDLLSDPERFDLAVERWGDVTIPAAIGQGKMMHAQYCFVPLHCGVDSFMSTETYEKHYWPPLKRLISALIGAGFTPIVLCEGSYHSRLEVLCDVPKDKVIYGFEDVDMKRAKDIVGKVACIAGNYPTQHLISGSIERVIDETKRMIDVCAPGGGYIMSNSLAVDNADHRLVEAWYETTIGYGKY